MSHNSQFLNDLQSGLHGEYLFLKYLQNRGLKAESAPHEYWPHYDILTRHDDKIVTYEVKYDRQIQDTGNLFFEFLNVNQQEPSGILKSKAVFIVYINAQTNEGFIWNRKKLLKTLFQHFHNVVMCKVDTQNALGYLVPMKKIMNIYCYERHILL